MDWLIWTGAVLTLLGVFGLVFCIFAAARAKRSGLEDDQMRSRLQQLVAWNMAALGVSALGLMAVIVGLAM